MKAICPNNPEHKRFVTTAHVVQEWVVDENGEFIEGDHVLEVTSFPDPDNIWTCKKCHAGAKIERD